jgi:hypothetical protein
VTTATGRAARLGVWALLALAPWPLACRSQEARALEAESARLGRAIDAVRDAPNAAKAPLVRALEAEPCAHPAACELKALCVRAYAKHVESIAASERARVLLAAPDGGSQAALEAASVLNGAEAALREAGKLTESCAARQGELRRKNRP